MRTQHQISEGMDQENQSVHLRQITTQQENRPLREGTPATPREGTPATPREGTPTTPREGTPATPREGTPATPREGTPDVPREESPDLDTSKLRSWVWEGGHMTRKMIDGQLKAICKYCNTKLAAGSKSGTRHLGDHVRSCLRKCKNSNPGAFQKLLALETKEGKTIIKNYSFDQTVCRNHMVRMIVLHEHPMSIVEQVGFRVFCKSMQPLFKVPTRNTVRADIFKLYKSQMKNTSELMEKNEGRVAITTDMWTADNQKKSYMAVTAHFVDQSWDLQQRLLRFQYVPSPHTIEVLGEYLMKVLLDWNLDLKLSTITLDNCSVNDGVVESLVRKLETDELLLGGEVLHMRCCAHILNLIVKDGLDVIASSLEKIRDSCVYWTGTPKKIERFEEAARQLRITCTKKLCYDVKTRWNSTYIMLETALTYKDVFPRLKLRDTQYKTLPSEIDWENAKIVSEKLKIFYTTTELFSGQKYPTANHFFANSCEIKLALTDWLIDPNPMISQMAYKMIGKYEKYWSKIHKIMGIAILLDPRFKMELIVYYYEKIYGNEHDNEVRKIVDSCRELFREYQRRASKLQVEDPKVGEGACSSDAPQDFELFAQRRNKRRMDITTELDHYLEEELVPRVPNFDVLTWWKSNGPKFPTLQKIARDIFAIPISSVASESAFSMGGRIISPHRNRLHPSLVEALACAQNWLRAEFEELRGRNPFYTYEDDVDDNEDQPNDMVIEEDGIEVVE